MRIGVFCSYYNRPLFFRKCLQSVLDAGSLYANWELSIGDDGSPNPAEVVVKDVMLYHYPHRVTVLNTNATREEKAQGIHRLGAIANQAIRESRADIGIFLCDDDLICPNYFKELDIFYRANPTVMYGYCDLGIYNPVKPAGVFYADKYNKDVDNPVNQLDASQISFRLDCFRSHGVSFPEQSSLVENLDAAVLRQMYEKFGKPTRLPYVGQHKGVHDYQMMWNKKKDIAAHLQHIDSLAGKVF
jgi:glycosyltransferase involved in cell wall biosynthesis